MSPKVLTPDQVEQFVEEGYTILREAFPRKIAHEVRKFILERDGVREDDPRTWTKHFRHLTESFRGEPFMSCYSPRYNAAMDDLMGEGRWIPLDCMGWWPAIFPGFDTGPWRVHARGWHVDGSGFHHHVDSPEQGMLPIFLFSDIGPGDGGTAIALRSHKVTARALHFSEPVGLSDMNVSTPARAAVDSFKQIEVQGLAGDVALLHPFMLHAVSTNVGDHIRLICNPATHFRERMNVTGDPARPVSAVEHAIIRALREEATATMAV
jgi:hypothetical protein